MKLYEYLQKSNDWENTVFDKDYDLEVYFYKQDDSKDRWDVAMLNLAKLLEVTNVSKYGVTVNLSDLIESKIDKLDKLFKVNEIDAIMYDMDNILAGNVSEKWLEKFVEELS